MIDPEQLPRRALLDTPVVIRALLGQRGDEAATPSCIDFVKAMLEHERELLIATPTLAEVLRGDASSTLPSTKGIEVVSFDRKAAVTLGTTFPADGLRKRAKGLGVDREIMYFDMLIVACAIRHRADRVITLDKGRIMRHLGLQSPLPISTPTDFQLPIFQEIEASKARER